jgi:hypothetical protein
MDLPTTKDEPRRTVARDSFPIKQENALSKPRDGQTITAGKRLSTSQRMDQRVGSRLGLPQRTKGMAAGEFGSRSGTPSTLHLKH